MTESTAKRGRTANRSELVVRGGTVVDATGSRRSDVRVVDGRVVVENRRIQTFDVDAMLRAARALAAFEQAPAVGVEHVERVSESVLVHRRKEGNPPGARGEQGAYPQTDERLGDSDESSFGYMPPEPVDISRVKNVRPLSSKKS